MNKKAILAVKWMMFLQFPLMLAMNLIAFFEANQYTATIISEQTTIANLWIWAQTAIYIAVMIVYSRKMQAPGTSFRILLMLYAVLGFSNMIIRLAMMNFVPLLQSIVMQKDLDYRFWMTVVYCWLLVIVAFLTVIFASLCLVLIQNQSTPGTEKKVMAAEIKQELEQAYCLYSSGMMTEEEYSIVRARILAKHYGGDMNKFNSNIAAKQEASTQDFIKS